MQMGPAGWSDISAWFIRAVNYILDRSDFEKQIVRIISKAENIFEHKDQNDIINDMARAMRSKRYDQQYNQDNPWGGNGYIVNSTYAKTKNLSKKPNV